MRIPVKCACGEVLRVSRERVGSYVACKKCGSKVLVPPPEESEQLAELEVKLEGDLDELDDRLSSLGGWMVTLFVLQVVSIGLLGWCIWLLTRGRHS